VHQTYATQRGFTLTELVTVIVLLGILSVTFLPKFFSRSDFDARGYFDQLISATRYAHKLALVSNCEVRLTIAAGSFTLEQPSSAAQCGSPATWQTVNLPGQAPPYNAPSGITATAATITFDAAGLASSDQTITVGGTHSFQIYADTGYVERL
jgi:MSHA pilin protein MshC